MPFSIAEVIRQLQRFERQPFSINELLGELNLSRSLRRKLVQFLDSLVVAGLIKHMRRGRYRVNRPLKLVCARLKHQSSGHGVLTDCDDGHELYVATFRLGGAMDGDEVMALELPESRGRRPEGWIVEVVKRSRETLLGVCEKNSRQGGVVFRSEQGGLTFDVDDRSRDVSLLVGQVVVLRIDRYPAMHENGLGHIVDVLGHAGSPEVDILSTVHRLGIPNRFSAAVEQAASAIAAEVPPEVVAARADLCSLPFVTIDGADARDFDDAVCLARSEDGHWRLHVAIADVGYYVEEGSALDLEARERGTSVYFPSRCLPMLPQALSNGICSLQPEKERLVVVAEITFDDLGRRLNFEAYRATIRSRQRLIYEQVQQVLDGQVPEIPVSEPLTEMLHQMQHLAQSLRHRRLHRGAIDFDLPEANVIFDDEGRIVRIGRRSRLDSHRLIEEFMLCANEAVAEFILSRRETGMFRIHESPDIRSMQSFQQFLATLNLGITLDEDGISARELRRLLHEVEGTSLEFSVNRILLRSMKQARYDAENSGHFGLASDAYCHFTSPIRRYPDLLVHRLLLQILDGRADWEADEPLPRLADAATAAERRAMEAERDIVDLRKCQFMEDKIGTRYSGYITSVNAFGFFVELDEFFVEGLVHIRTLSDDYYVFDEERLILVGQARRKTFQVGDTVEVEVWQIKSAAREIDFVLPDLEVSLHVSRRRRLGERRKRRR
ncbi:ribonuclease R [Desulfuromonas acetoxidans]|uniref:Ribonuclease R n=1 Tax=Desulfuromonas acetoxidans (strain DSM 684 / 11070) TaxID=281689 RepID=Q1K2V6_DESA6|nr:ribonuclease R [Desulfuromonas acetoxidans]EAT16775.1 Ribonuclease R [Desulfuromonas acetoxidans DSM 684]MBF0644677.1 ribonuclease R [Desulfuromonas acetoxidans]NVD23716.1 ribonuclease R [Desulfuromonas acetoxidans]NVE15887.1 ribonuclease R [Desulfuromonas acetoxidans]